MLIILSILLFNIVHAKDYCKLCENGTHTMCMYKEGPTKACIGYKKQPLTLVDKKYIVDIHNDIRNHVASGHESKGTLGGQPSAANMSLLEWDDELAEIAQRWADQCVKIDAAQQHDVCKRVERFDVGQNILTAITGDSDMPDLSVLILNWYKQVINVIPSDIDSFVGIRRGKYLIGQYTQLVWAKTKYVGCGMSVFKDVSSLSHENDQYHHRLVCNYGPTGNIIGEAVYERGLPCSKCPYRLCDNLRTNLCKSFEKSLLNFTILTQKNTSNSKKLHPRQNTSIFNKTANKILKYKINTTICVNPDEISNTTKLKEIKCITGIDSNQLEKNTTIYNNRKYSEIVEVSTLKFTTNNYTKNNFTQTTIASVYKNNTVLTLFATNQTIISYSTQKFLFSTLKEDLNELKISSTSNFVSSTQENYRKNNILRERKYDLEDRYIINEDYVNNKNFSKYPGRYRQMPRHSTFRPVFTNDDEIVFPNQRHFKKAKGTWQNGHCRCNMIYRSNSKNLKFTLLLQWMQIFTMYILIC